MSRCERIKLVHTSHTPSKELTAFRDLAEYLGVPWELCWIEDLLKAKAKRDHEAVVLEVRSLLDDSLSDKLINWWSQEADAGPGLLLVTDLGAGGLLSRLTRGIVPGVEASESATLEFPRQGELLSKELSGLCFPRRSSVAFQFTPKVAEGIMVIMRQGNAPNYMTWEEQGTRVFAWATPRVMRVDEVVESELDFELNIDTVIPAIMFLRWAFPEQCWRNPLPTAGLVIDDPLLTEKYGYVDFSRLLASAHEHHYHVSVAFVPWNGRRTRVEKSSTFREFRENFSLCVHGCDHTNNEYGCSDYELLADKTCVALERMDQHAVRVGIPYAPLMVCPQEQCSIEGWKAIADSHRILGMVNTACLPRNIENEIVRMSDLLLPAQDALHALPLIKRWYSRAGFHNFALALFLGKPAIIVEHHEYFREGTRAIEDFVARLRHACPEVRWPSLEMLAVNLHQLRSPSNGRTEVRFFTNRFVLPAELCREGMYRLQKRVQDRDAIERVLVNGYAVDYSYSNELLTIEVSASDGHPIVVELHYARPPRRAAYSYGLPYQLGVASRRLLSEYRDNVLVRHKRLLALARMAISALRMGSRRGAGAQHGGRKGGQYDCN